MHHLPTVAPPPTQHTRAGRIQRNPQYGASHRLSGEAIAVTAMAAILHRATRGPHFSTAAFTVLLRLSRLTRAAADHVTVSSAGPTCLQTLTATAISPRIRLPAPAISRQGRASRFPPARTTAGPQRAGIQRRITPAAHPDNINERWGPKGPLSFSSMTQIYFINALMFTLITGCPVISAPSSIARAVLVILLAQ